MNVKIEVEKVKIEVEKVNNSGREVKIEYRK